MAEKSYWWTTGGAGDGAVTYTRTDLSEISKVLAACQAFEGIAPNYLGSMALSSPAANTLRVASGGAVVDGKPYYSSANVDINVPSAVGAGNTRIDLIVLRADWTAQTVRLHRIAGVDAASPTPPARSTTSGTLYDIIVTYVTVNTAGALTIGNERQFAQAGDEGLEASAVTSQSIADNAISNAKLRDSIALSVIGRSANSGGDPADIQAGSDGYVLQRSASALVWGPVTSSNIQDGGVGTADLANNAVTDAKIGPGVPAVMARKGGSATHWKTPGSTTYTLPNTRIAVGSVALGANGAIGLPVGFGVTFSGDPIVLVTATTSRKVAYVGSINTTSATIYALNDDGTTPGDAGTIYWMAIGPE